MDFVTNLANGFRVAAEPINLLYAFAGAALGTSVGVLPGLGTVATVAILLPVTYKMGSVPAVIMLAGIFYGAQYGGSTTSILLNIPGEASSVVTCIDGYKMACQGRAGAALGISAMGSFIAGTLGVLGLSMIAPGLGAFALRFGPPEYFSLVLVGLIMTVYLSEESILKGLVMGALGLFLGVVGLDPVQGVDRFTFGFTKLSDGIDLVTVAMGLFGISEILINAEMVKGQGVDIFKAPLKGLLPTRDDWRRCWASILRGSLIGFFIGVLPGGGVIISSFVSYTVEKRVSKNPEQFGKGAIEGVAAPEAANNAASISSFVPLLTLGIPGNATTAMILVALMIHGVSPGPMMIQKYPDLFWGTVASMYIGNIMLLGLNLPLIGLWVRVLRVPYKFIATTVIVICMIGAYSINNSIFDVGIMVFMGIFGYIFRKNGYPPAPLVFAMILGRMLELSLQQSLIGSAGDFFVFFKSPISAGFLFAGGVLILKPAVRLLWKQKRRMK
jgi:putative tricarboxylic transport membrane protein